MVLTEEEVRRKRELEDRAHQVYCATLSGLLSNVDPIHLESNGIARYLNLADKAANLWRNRVDRRGEGA